jgi:hypothetical protein
MTFPIKLLLVVLALTLVATGQTAVRQVGMVDIPGRPGFDEMVFAKGMLLVSHTEAGTVEIFDPVKRRVIGQVKQLSDPRGLALSGDGSLVFVANSRGHNIVVLSTEDWQVKETIAVDGVPYRLQWVGAWNRLLVTLPEQSSLASVDVAHRTQAGSVRLGGKPEYMAWDESRGQADVTLQDAKGIAAIDSSLNVVRRIPVHGSMPTGLAYDPHSDHLYVSVRGAVVALNAGNGEETSRVTAPMGVDQLWLDTAGRLLLGYSKGELLLVHAGSELGRPQSVKVELAGHTVAFDGDRRTIFIPGGREGKSKLVMLKAGSAAEEKAQEARK